MISTCFCSVIHPGNSIYFPDFLRSLQSQTDTNFTLLLFNDGVNNIDLYMDEYKLSYKIFEIIGSIAEIRYHMLQELLSSEFEFVVFGDTDDFFPANRIAINKLLLQNNDIVINDLWITDTKGKILTESYWKNRKILKCPIAYNSIKDYNFIGLGNTAIRTEVLKNMPNFDATLKVVDWFLFSVLLYKNNLKVFFTSKTHIFYRQHHENLIGRKEITLPKIKSICAVKSKHYTMLAKEIPEVSKKASRYDSFIKNNNFSDITYLNNYITQTPTPFWWEEFIL